ncbi:unnamed protein product [Adineta ricciae]|nr:unnamed protein product [Adineta ricciae]
MIQITIADNTFPQILTETTNQTLNISSTAILTCHIRDLGEHHVTWFKYDPLTSLSSPLAVGKQLFTTDERYSISFYSISSRDSLWSLEIYQLRQSDEGTYICKIANRKASVSVSMHLHIQTPMILSPTNVYIEPGGNILLNCTLVLSEHDHDSDENNKRSPITWHFLSNQINKTKPHDVYIRRQSINNTFSSFLIISSAHTTHSGIWTCAYRRQRLSAKILVEKDILKHQRFSALLANSSPRQMTLIQFWTFVFYLFLVFKY